MTEIIPEELTRAEIILAQEAAVIALEHAVPVEKALRFRMGDFDEKRIDLDALRSSPQGEERFRQVLEAAVATEQYIHQRAASIRQHRSSGS